MSEPTYEIDTSSLSDRAYLYIKKLVLSGELKGGEAISERTLASRFGLSRTPLRDALRRLEQYGLIESKPRSPSIIASLAPEEAEDVANVRVALETVAVRALVQEATDADLEALSDIATQCATALRHGDIAKTFELDSHLHLDLAERSGNRHLFDQYQRLDARVQLLRLVLHLPREHLGKFVGQHWPLLDAIRERDESRAVRLMERHVLDQLKYHEHAESSARLLAAPSGPDRLSS